MAAVGGDEAGIGSAVTNTLRQVGGAVAVAGLGSLLSAVYSDRLAPSLVGLPHQASSQASGSVMGAMAVAQGAGTRGVALAHDAGVSFVAGMSAVMSGCVAVVLVGAVLVLRFLPARAVAAGTPSVPSGALP